MTLDVKDRIGIKRFPWAIGFTIVGISRAQVPDGQTCTTGRGRQRGVI